MGPYRKRFSFVFVIAACFSLAACGIGGQGSDGADDVTRIEVPAKEGLSQVTINVLTQMIEPKAVLRKFQDEFPGITVKWEQIDTKTVREVMKTRLAAGGEGLDIISPQLNDYIPLAEQGTWVDLTGEDEMIANIDAKAIEQSAKVGGKVYGIPFARQAYVVWYNKDIFQRFGLEVPRNWEEFLTVSNTLKSNGIAPLVLAGKDEWLVSVLSGLPYSGLFNEEPNWITKLDRGEAKWTDENSIAALKKFKLLADNGYLYEGSLGTGEDQAYQVWLAGKAAMIVNGTWAVDRVAKHTPTFGYGIFAPPGNDQGTPKVAFIYGNIYAVTTHSKHPEEALTFLRFLTRPENTQIFMDEIKQFTNVLGVTADFHAAAKEIEPIWKLDRTQMLHAQAAPAVRSVQGKTLQKLIAGQLTPEGAAEELQAAQEREE